MNIHCDVLYLVMQIENIEMKQLFDLKGKGRLVEGHIYCSLHWFTLFHIKTQILTSMQHGIPPAMEANLLFATHSYCKQTVVICVYHESNTIAVNQ